MLDCYVEHQAAIYSALMDKDVKKNVKDFSYLYKKNCDTTTKTMLLQWEKNIPLFPMSAQSSHSLGSKLATKQKSIRTGLSISVFVASHITITTIKTLITCLPDIVQPE